jgi:hypothetical protein
VLLARRLAIGRQGKYFSFHQVQTEPGAPGVKKSLEHEGDHSSLSSAKVRSVEIYLHSFMSWQVQWKPLITNTLGPALFDNNNRLITLSGGYKNLYYLTQFTVTTLYVYKKQQNLFKKLM